jgi:2-C-methyl-D-erythritol 2,4-cyclodiphosphate synthase
MRVGFGYDSHPFDDSRECVLGGVRIPGAPGLKGFSDGDAVAHAVTDALLGAASLGDIGVHFPPGDERWRDADSMDLLGRAVSLVHGAGYAIENVDVTVLCETPKIAPIAERMRGELARRLQVDSSCVSVKGKTNEGMGWIGRSEGLAVHAVALLTVRA